MSQIAKFIPILSLTVPLANGCSRSESSSSSAATDGKLTPAALTIQPANLLPALQALATSLPAEFDAIPEDRRVQLDKLALFLRTRRDSGETAQVVFICTHNSRRSHLGQVTAMLAAAFYGLDRVEAFSGGTEVTAFNPRAVTALERLGFEIENPGGDNPHYKVAFAENRPPIEAFSKKYDDPYNPKDGFVAVMTCDHADQNCPIVAGAALRIPLHFVDPKVSDGTPAEAVTYDERTRQIATEIFYAMSRVRA